MLVMVCGLPFSGKSTVADVLAERIDGTVLRADVIRKQLLKKPTYKASEKDLIYGVMFLIAEYLLYSDLNVILDATFYKKRLRERAYGLSKKTGSDLYIIECVCPEDVIRERSKRTRNRISDADFKVYRKIKRVYEPIERGHLVVDTTEDIKKNMEKTLKYIKWL